VEAEVAVKQRLGAPTGIRVVTLRDQAADSQWEGDRMRITKYTVPNEQREKKKNGSENRGKMRVKQ
jgi:hypothetical protein